MTTQSAQSKSSKGSVGIESFQGRLRLRLPRQVYGGKQKYLSLGLADTLENRKIADGKAKQIESDIKLERFDSSLNKYRPDYLKLLELVETPKQEVKLLELWDKYTEFRKPQIAVTTLKAEYSRYRNHISNLPSQQIEDSIVIRDYLIGNKSPSVAKKVLTQLNACCSWALKSGMIKENPFNGMAMEINNSIQSSPEDINPFNKEEVEAIIKGFATDNYYSYYTSFVRFLFLTGCRTSEAVGLRWGHISANLTTINFCEAYTKGCRKDTKTHKSRKFPINSQLRELLEAIRPESWSPESLVFSSPKNGKEIDAHNFLNRAWKSVLSKIGIPYRCQYTTRHTFITFALENGLDAKDVARLVGNSAEMIYKHYAGSNLSKLQVPEF